MAAVWIALALKAIAAGLAKIAKIAKIPFLGSPRLKAAGVFAAISLVALPVAAHYRTNDQSANYLAEEWGRNIFSTLEEDAVILPTSDHSTFPLIYLQAVEGLRPDVLVADKYGYIEDRAFYELFDGKKPPRAPPPRSADRTARERYLIEHSRRPVYFTTNTRVPSLRGYEIVTCGLLFKAVRSGREAKEAEHEAVWSRYEFRPESLALAPGDFSNDLILADYHYARARYHLTFEREKEAFEAFDRAAEHAFGIKEIENNLGGTLADAGENERAIRFFKRALAVDPDYDLAIKNLANVYFSLERYEAGRPWFWRARELEPRNPVALLGTARAYTKRDRSTAYASYTLVYSLAPSETLRKEIEAFVEKAFGKESLELAAFQAQAESVAQRSRSIGSIPQPELPAPGAPGADSLLPEVLDRHKQHGGRPRAPPGPFAPDLPGFDAH